MNNPHWKKRVREEFDMPVLELVMSFARDGYSKRLTAGAMGISPQTLRVYCSNVGVAFNNQAEMRHECKPRPRKKGIVRNPSGRPKLSDEHILSCVADAATISNVKGVSVMTIYRRFNTFRNAKKLANRRAA